MYHVSLNPRQTLSKVPGFDFLHAFSRRLSPLSVSPLIPSITLTTDYHHTNPDHWKILPSNSLMCLRAWSPASLMCMSSRRRVDPFVQLSTLTTGHHHTTPENLYNLTLEGLATRYNSVMYLRAWSPANLVYIYMTWRHRALTTDHHQMNNKTCIM